MEPKFSFCLNLLNNEQENYMLKISSEFYELNIILTKDELSKIPEVVNARWDNRTCLKLGKCIDAPTWWSLEEDSFSILAGHDDECWEFAVSIPRSYLENLFDEIDKMPIK